MGMCKNKWTAEEEAAIRNGVTKHGAGKWRTILSDPEFSTALVHRTNVSLKDKWRNMNVGKVDSRNTCKPVRKIMKKPTRHYNELVAFTSECSGKDEIARRNAPAIVHESSKDESFDKLISRFDHCKLDDLNGKQPSSYTVKQVQHETEYDSADSDRVKAVVDAEVMRIRHMNPEDAAAAAAAAPAVKMAEAAIAEAEEAEKEALEAERFAKEQQSVADELERKLEEMKARAAPKQGRRCRRN